MPVPYTFGTATAAIPLSQLDSNFSTAITIGNTAVQLGNTVTTLNNMTLANVTISSGNVTLTNVSVTTANVSGTANVSSLVVLTNETVLGNTAVTGKVTASINVTGAKLIPTGTSVTGNGLYLPAANALGLSTNGTNAVYIDASQNVGIGVTPSAWFSSYKALQIGATTSLFNDGGTTSRLSNNAFVNAGGNIAYISTAAASYYQQSGGAHNWQVAASGTAGNTISFTQAMTLDASGNLGLGQTSITDGQGFGRVMNITNGSTGGAVYLQTSTSTNYGWFGKYNASTQLGDSGSAGLTFYTGNGSGSVAERARIDSSGSLLVGTTTNTAIAKLTVEGTTGIAVERTGSGFRQMYMGSSVNTMFFYNGTNQASLTSAGVWTNASDARLKKNIRTIEYGLNTVLGLQPRHFERVDVEGTFIGFVAQELQTVIPEVVSGDPERQLGVDYGSLVAVAFKAIQEQQALIQSLTARITALEAK